MESSCSLRRQPENGGRHDHYEDENDRYGKNRAKGGGCGGNGSQRRAALKGFNLTVRYGDERCWRWCGS